jgi:methionine-rich copper-binding protein CopC
MTPKPAMFAIMASSILVLSGTIGAAAHPRLLSAVPAADGTVKTAPNEVTLRFNERLEPAFSSVIIVWVACPMAVAGANVEVGESRSPAGHVILSLIAQQNPGAPVPSARSRPAPGNS